MRPQTHPQLVIKNRLPKVEEDFTFYLASESELSKKPMLEISHGSYDWGNLVSQVITAPGFCIIAGAYEITSAINIEKEPLEPVLNLHVQMKNEAYCSFSGLEKFLIKEDVCSLFVQSTKIAASHLLPGTHQQLNFFYTERFLDSIVDDLPEIRPLLQLLSNKQPTPVNDKVCVASPKMQRLIEDFGIYVYDQKLETPFCRHTAIQVLKEFLR